MDSSNKDEDENDINISEIPRNNRWGNYNEPIGEPTVLEPDHPLMQKFQETYKKCLTKENEKLDTEILELRENLKKRKHDFERQMGNEMYQLEQEVSYQRKIIKEYETALQNATKHHFEREVAVKKARDYFKEKLEILTMDKKKEAELVGELEALTLLTKQYESWQKETDSELAVNQRISEKLGIEKKTLSEEKKLSDMLVYKLTTEVWNLESQIELLDGQIKIKNDELEEIKNRSSDSETDLEALQVEQNHLIKLWNSVIVNIGKKDKIYSEIQTEIENVKAEIQTIVANIECYKRDTLKEMQRNEELTKMKEKACYKLAELNKEVDRYLQKQSKIEMALMETSETFELTEKDLNLSRGENIQLTNKLKGLNLQFEKCLEEKIRMENDTLDKLQELLSCDKASENIANQIRKLKENSRKEEMNILKNENKNARILYQIEKQKTKNHQIILQIEEEKQLFEEKGAELTCIENKIKEVLLKIDKMQNNLDIANKKIFAQLEKTDGKEILPIERKIQELERLIEEQANKTKDLQGNWLRMQGHIVELTGQLQKQISEINLVKEQILILENKKMKLENAINNLKQESIEVKRSLDGLQNQINQLTKQMYLNREQNVELEAKYNSLTLDYSAKLKDAEMLAVIAEEEKSALEEEKIKLAVDLHKLKRDALSWQKMEMMAVETRDKVSKERNSGEICQMKSEIHRMQVRKSQVTSTAARLASDLALAVERRAAATNRARAGSKSLAPRHTILFKIKEKRADIKRLKQEILINKSLIENSIEQRKSLQVELDEKETSLAELKNDYEDLKKLFLDNQLMKQKNLEQIIRHQRYGKLCSSILNGSARIFSVKSEPIINVEYEKQKRMNSQLTAAVEKLLIDLPEYHENLQRILNTLNVEDD